MLSTNRAVLIRYQRGNTVRRGSGLHVGGRYVLTAAHCAVGTDHVIVVEGAQYPATVWVRSGDANVDIAVLECPELHPVQPLQCAAVGWETAGWVRDCHALGFPLWKDGKEGPLLAQVPADIPVGEGVAPLAGPGAIPPLSIKITNPAIREYPIPVGELDQAGSPWAGMSGAVVVTRDDFVVGVIRGHSPAEGSGSLIATRLGAIAALPPDIAERFLSALEVPHPRQWRRLPAPDAPGLKTEGQVVVGEIPREPPAFVSREAVRRLAEVAERAGIALVSAVTGLRGVGKTQVAAAYARTRVTDGWELVGWVNAETRDSLLAGLTRIAERLEIADPDGDSLESAHRLREHLQTDTKHTLLVFDNAADPDELRAVLPATGSAQVVITSTDQAFADFGEPVDVSVFTRAESLRYLGERTRLRDDPGADEVAHELGDLPLALAQAAATIRRQRLTYLRYLERLRQVPVRDLLGRAPGSDYPNATAAALLLAIEAAEASDPTGLTNLVLRVLAALSPDGVGRDFLNGLGGSADSPAIDEALERCVTGSLVTWSLSGDTVVMHRLLGRVLRERDRATGTWPSTVTAALDLIETQLFPREQAWARRSDGTHLIAQIEALWQADQGKEPGIRELRLRQLSARSWAVHQLRMVADLSLAVDLGRRAAADSEKLLGPDHEQTLDLNNELAFTYRPAGRLEDSIALFERTVADRQRVLGKDHPDTLHSRSGLAGAYRRAGRVSEAITLYEQNLADRERILGPDDPRTLSSRNDLGISYMAAGRLSEGTALYERNLADRERVLGPDHPETLASRSNLGYAYRTAGRLNEAIELYERTLADREKVLGPDHPETMTSRSNLGYAYRTAGRLNETIELYERTLADRERILGPDHPQTVLSRNNLAGGYRAAERFTEAIALLERTVADRERILGPDHPQTLLSRNGLASTYASAGRLGEAISLFERTLGDRERILGTEHPHTMTSRSDLAGAYLDAGYKEKAIQLLERTLAEREQTLSDDHPDTVDSRNNLARAYEAAGRLDEAIVLYERALNDGGRIPGSDHRQIDIIRTNLERVRAARRGS